MIKAGDTVRDKETGLTGTAMLDEKGGVVYVVPFKNEWGKQRRTRDGIIGLSVDVLEKKEKENISLEEENATLRSPIESA